MYINFTAWEAVIKLINRFTYCLFRYSFVIIENDSAKYIAFQQLNSNFSVIIASSRSVG